MPRFVPMPSAAFEVFYDGACPLCAAEIRMIQRLDRRRRVRYTDIASADFDAAAAGVSWDDLMARIHGRMPDGTLIEGVEVFRQLYSAVGLAPLVALTRLPLLSSIAERCYRVFARNRLRITGRCEGGACGVPPPSRRVAAR